MPSVSDRQHDLTSEGFLPRRAIRRSQCPGRTRFSQSPQQRAPWLPPVFACRSSNEGARPGFTRPVGGRRNLAAARAGVWRGPARGAPGRARLGRARLHWTPQAVHVIVNATLAARCDGHRRLDVWAPGEVQRTSAPTGTSDDVEVFDLGPRECRSRCSYSFRDRASPRSTAQTGIHLGDLGRDRRALCDFYGHGRTTGSSYINTRIPFRGFAARTSFARTGIEDEQEVPHVQSQNRRISYRSRSGWSPVQDVAPAA
jgi:hypothetical protein